MDRGAWRATVHGVTKSRTELKQLSTYTHTHMIIHPCNRAIKIRIQIIEIYVTKKRAWCICKNPRCLQFSSSQCREGKNGMVQLPGGSQCVLRGVSLGNSSAALEPGSFLVICPGKEVGQKRLRPWL